MLEQPPDLVSWLAVCKCPHPIALLFFRFCGGFNVWRSFIALLSEVGDEIRAQIVSLSSAEVPLVRIFWTVLLLKLIFE